MKKEILIIAATHGDEKIGIETMRELKKRKLQNFCDFLIANPRALKSKKRFMEKDMNRSYPGNKYSPYYEERLAYKNLLVAKNYRYVIDIHEADKSRNDFVIVPNNKLPQKFPLECIALDKVLLWPYPEGPISQVLDNAIELEFGTKCRAREEMIKRAVNIIEKFIFNIRNGKFAGNAKEFFYVYGILKTEELKDKINDLVEFKETKISGENFLPLLVEQYLDLGVACYKMKKINLLYPRSRVKLGMTD